MDADRLPGLTVLQTRMLALIDDGAGAEDAVGFDVTSLPPDRRIACMQLVGLGLVEVRSGWRGSFWFRLSPRGRALRSGSLRAMREEGL